MALGGGAVRVARQHPAQLDHPGMGVEGDDLGPGPAPVLGLPDPDLSIGQSGHLGQVGDHQHLGVPAEPGQGPPTAVAAAPPTPESTSSNTITPGESVVASRTASMVRASSPPEAALASGCMGSPGLAPRRNVT